MDHHITRVVTTVTTNTQPGPKRAKTTPASVGPTARAALYAMLIAVMAYGWPLLMVLAGFTGLFSLGHAAFLGVGAYTQAIMVNAGLPFPLALACAGGTAGLFRDVAIGGARAGQFQLATLHAGERLLAFSTVLTGTGRWYGFKSAFDETAARYGPGVLLLDWITRRFADQQSATSFDSPSRSPSW